MVILQEVDYFISENILHSEVWDTSDGTKRNKAVNQATRTLMRLFPKVYTDPTTIPFEHLAEQSIWIMKIDDSFQRAELGVTFLMVDGISMNISDKDRSVAPFILEVNKVSNGFNKRIVGSYTRITPNNSNRKGW